MMIPRGMGLTCPPGQSPTNMYDGTVKCCGGPAATDPCSILNNPAFLQAQNTRVEQDITDLGPDSAAAALASVPINIGDAAVFCSNHPGNNFADPISGQVIACPAGGHQDLSGAFWSNYTVQQLANMLNAQYGAGAPATPGNAPTVGAQIPANLIEPLVTPKITPAPVTPKITGQPIPTPVQTDPVTGAPIVTATATSTMDLSFLTNSTLITGIPNWAVAVGVVAALMIVPQMLGGRR